MQQQRTSSGLPRRLALRFAVSACLGTFAVAPALAIAYPFAFWRPLEKIALTYEGDQCGWSVAMDGNYMVAGAPHDYYDEHGAVYVFEYDDTWEYTWCILDYTGDPTDSYGAAVDVDEDWTVIGSPWHDGAGAAYFFRKGDDSVVWYWEATVSDESSSYGAMFGLAVAVERIDDEHGIIVVGAPYYGSNAAGKAYVYWFYKRSVGWDWVLFEKSGTEPNEFLGAAVAIQDGTIMIGAPGREVDSRPGAGAVDVYTFQQGEGYVLLVDGPTLTAETGDIFAEDHFGSSIAISSTAAVIGAPLHDSQGEDAGAAHVFTGSGASYSYADKLMPEEDTAGALYGMDVDAYGSLMVVGALGHDDYTGAAYLHNGSGNSWPLVQKLTAYDGESGDRFGTAVALNNDFVMVGSPYDDHYLGEDAGSVYPFEREPLEFEFAQLTPDVPACASATADLGPSFFVGGEAKMPSGDWVAIVWEEIDDQWQHHLLPDLLGGGSRVNALGSLRGEELYAGGTAMDTEGNWQPVVWSCADGQWVLAVLPKPVAAVSGEVLSINEDSMGRLIATGSASVTEGFQVAVVWTRLEPGDWTIAVLPPLVPGKDSVACDYIESDGPIVIGYAYDDLDRMRAVIWDHDGPIWQIAPLPNLPAGVQSAAFGGTSGATPIIAGWSETAAGDRHAVRWVLEDNLWQAFDLGAPGCLLNSQAIASAWPDDWEMPWLTGFADSGAGTAEAMLWFAQGPAVGAINLNDIVGDEWIIRRATSISQSGRIAAWGVQPGAEDEPRAFVLTVSSGSCFGDLDGNGEVGLGDLAQLLAHYGTTSGAMYEDGDLDGDADVDLGDLAALLAVYGTTCE